MPPPSQPRGTRGPVERPRAPAPDGCGGSGRRRAGLGARASRESSLVSAHPTPRRGATTRRESRSPAAARRTSSTTAHRRGANRASLPTPVPRRDRSRAGARGPGAGGRGRARRARQRPVPNRGVPRAHRVPNELQPPERRHPSRAPPSGHPRSIPPARSIGWADRASPAPREPRAAGGASRPAGSGRPNRRPARHRSLPPPPPARARRRRARRRQDPPTWPCTGPARRVSP